MSDPTVKTDIDRLLREMAETRLRTGTALISSSYSLGPDALGLLHRLSSNPETAADALKLLHELQVHQEELDLQNEVIKNNEHVLTHDLSHYRSLYERAPAAYLLVDLDGRILKANRMSEELLNVREVEIGESYLKRHLAPESHAVVHRVLEKIRDGGSREIAEVITAGTGTDVRRLVITASPSPDKRHALIVCSDLP